MTALYAATETDDDDFFTSCQGCDKKFDDEDRLPLNLDCQHTMCITCVKVSHFDDVLQPVLTYHLVFSNYMSYLSLFLFVEEIVQK